MKENSFELHIVSFTIPYPANYGGVIDVFQRLKSLHQLGARIHLHCFQYGRQTTAELQKYCENVFYYKRKRGILPFLSSKPYIVSSRTSRLLLQRIKEIQCPILFEGEHTTAYIDHPDLSGRPKFVRLHNVEYDYYERLANETPSFFKKLYFHSEARKLKRYEEKLSLATTLLSISTAELPYFRQINDQCLWLPAFHFDIEQHDYESGSTGFLYHGDLTILFNQQVVKKVVAVFENTEETLTIAGKMTERYRKKLTEEFPGVRIKANLSHEQMSKELKSSRNHLIFAEHAQGVKLKLIHSLLSGARVFANANAVKGSELSSCVHLTELNELDTLLEDPESIEFKDYTIVQSILDQHYDNRKNAQLLLETMFR